MNKLKALEASFNSTMVRLKACRPSHPPAPQFGFNSTMVRLKVRPVTFHRLFVFGFNSTMVRLKGLRRIWESWSISKFQFHNGSIKSDQGFTLQGIAISVSIPQWFD